VQFFSAFIAICSVLAAHAASAGELKIPKIDAAKFSGARPPDWHNSDAISLSIQSWAGLAQSCTRSRFRL
jgi:hypothetical protein